MCVVIWAVSLGQNGAVDIFLAYFIDRLDCMDGVNIDGYTLGQHHHHVVSLVLTVTDLREIPLPLLLCALSYGRSLWAKTTPRTSS